MLEIRLLGNFAITVSGAQAASLRSQVAGSVIALLALRGGRPIEREWLAETLWPDSTGEQSLYNLRRNLTDIRHVLGTEAFRLKSPTARTLSLDLTDAFCDVLEFDHAIQKEQWQEALQLYAGPLLPREDSIWVVGEREAREITYLKALETLSDHALGRKHYAEAINLLQQTLRVVPGREYTVRNLMMAYAATGNRVDALLTYRNFRLYLHQQQLGKPSHETTQLYETLRTVPSSSENKPSTLQWKIHTPGPLQRV